MTFDPLPYLQLPELVLLPAGRLGANSPPLSLKPFGLLVGTGVYLGAWLAMRYGRRRGLSPNALISFIYWVVACGFVGGHVLDVVFYSPERMLAEPLVLLRLWDGLSSFGGFIGAALGAALWKRRHHVRVLPYADVVASALPLGWVFGRAGCAVVHDHPGIASTAWFAVAYPGGSRLDLGLLETALTLPLALTFLWLQRRAWPWGFFVGWMCIVYAPVRFGLDFLRIRENVDLPEFELVADRRYAGLTPAQWACLLLLAAGVVILRRALASTERGDAFDAPKPPRAFAPRPASDAELQSRRSDAGR
jgi:phosphatidylglycerol:prolipoprotein diacylglycerol transferase